MTLDRSDREAELSQAEREARSAAYVAAFIDGIRALEGKHEVKQPLPLGVINHLAFLRELVERGQLTGDTEAEP